MAEEIKPRIKMLIERAEQELKKALEILTLAKRMGIDVREQEFTLKRLEEQIKKYKEALKE